jgi:hypothetical protein
MVVRVALVIVCLVSVCLVSVWMMVAGGFEMNIELSCRDAASVDAGQAQAVIANAQLPELRFEIGEIETIIEQSADHHVSAHSGETVKV